MPSDPSNTPSVAPAPAPVASGDLSALVAAVEPAYETFRSTAAAAAEGVRSLLARRSPATPVATGLGAFGASRIDADRFAGLLVRDAALDGESLDALRAAGAVLREAAAIAARDAIVVRVDSGARMRDAVSAALARLGRVFGAARVASFARSGRYRADAHAALLAGLPPAQWTSRERATPPPLVIDVDGADLDAPALAEHLDGAARFVLNVRGPAAPAPLARLVTPRTFVAQTRRALPAAFASASGPAIVAIVPDGCACFIHDPGAPTPEGRLTIEQTPSAPPRGAIGRWSLAQQSDELAMLRAWREHVGPQKLAPSGASTPSAADDDPTSRLTGWLLASIDEARLR